MSFNQSHVNNDDIRRFTPYMDKIKKISWNTIAMQNPCPVVSSKQFNIFWIPFSPFSFRLLLLVFFEGGVQYLTEL